MRRACEDVSTTRRKPLIKDLPCSAEGCGSKALLRSGGGPACNRHYQLWLKYGSFVSSAHRRQTTFVCSECSANFERAYGLSDERKRRPQYCSSACMTTARRTRALAAAEKRFWSRVDKRGPDECWEWRGARNENGYGWLNTVASPSMLANRVAYHFATGIDPGPLLVCHSCDNPPCCNPRHLWLGTHSDNMADMHAKGRRRVGGRTHA